MTVTVIIPTYNGALKLPLLLSSLEKQTYKDFELLIVIDGSTDNTVSVIENYTSLFSNFKYIEQENKGRSAVKNLGAKVAKGDLLIFFDDDLILDDHCVGEHVNHHIKYPYSILSGGLRSPQEDNPTELSKVKEYFGKRWNKTLIESNYQPLNENNYFVTAANLSLKKEIFFKIGGFDERLNDAEDFDFGTEALKTGVLMFFNENASGIHNENPTTKQYIRRLNQYRSAREQLIRFKPLLYENNKKINVNPPKGLKKIFFQIFRSPWWIESIDERRWIWLPENVRFKLYDYIITANSIF
jgi:glycosyltransferase involved in cell wall biosynthesis